MWTKQTHTHTHTHRPSTTRTAFPKTLCTKINKHHRRHHHHAHHICRRPNNNKFMNSNKLLWGRNLCERARSFARTNFRVPNPQTNTTIQQYIAVALQLCAIFSLIEFLFCLEFFIREFFFHSTIAVILQSIKMKALFLRFQMALCTVLAEVKSEEKHKISNTF